MSTIVVITGILPRSVLAGMTFEKIYIKMRWGTQRIDTVVNFAIHAELKMNVT